MTWKPEYSDRGNEAYKVKYDIVKYTRGKVLDLGSGPWKPFPHFIGVDTRDEWTDLPWNPDIIMDATNLNIFATNSFDAVFSSFLLDQVDDLERVELNEAETCCGFGGLFAVKMADISGAMLERKLVTAQGGNMVVDFYPVKTPYGDISTEWCLQVLSWEGVNQISKKFLSANRYLASANAVLPSFFRHNARLILLVFPVLRNYQ